ncbi:hypothetical protein C4D60_Mb04t16510 [Musa balbisiana]|uniref:Uncharacterized protein n=1 Tax=Musa balbisiana TaxID=52838 RepID=A0A4S8KCH1_MUSBA|nr:hypothetical protein C4D60_Mb04t16510 [Musa balbisiana]
MTDHFPFVIPDPATTFADPFAPDPVAGFAAPLGGGHLDHGPFRLSDFGSSASAVAAEFDSDEWIESLIGDSLTESSDLMGDPWQGAADGSGALFADAFPSCSTDFSPPSPPASASDLNNVLFSEHCEIAPLAPVQHLHQTAAVVALNRPGPTAHAPSFDPPELNKNSGGAAVVRDQAPESSVSSQPLLESLLDCARIADSDPDLAAKSLIHVRESASGSGDPTERIAFYFAEALYRRLHGAQRKQHSYPSTAAAPPSCSSSSFDSSPEDFTLCYKALNDACPCSKFAHLTANQATVEATESAAWIHIVDFGDHAGSPEGGTPPGPRTRPTGKPSMVRDLRHPRHQRWEPPRRVSRQ